MLFGGHLVIAAALVYEAYNGGELALEVVHSRAWRNCSQGISVTSPTSRGPLGGTLGKLCANTTRALGTGPHLRRRGVLEIEDESPTISRRR